MNLRVIDAEPAGSDIVERLEELLGEARAGKLSSLAFAVVYRDGSTGNGHSVLASIATMIGSVEALKFELLKMLTGDEA